MSARPAAPDSCDTFPKLLLRNAGERSEAPALREKRRGIWRSLSWTALAGEALDLASALKARGLDRGAHVALIGENRPRLFAGMAAAQALGAVAMPLFPDATADEVAERLRASGATHVFAENQEHVDKLLEVLPRCPDVRCIIYDDDRSMGHYKQPQLIHYDTLLAERGDREAARRELEAGSGGDPAFLFFTSGAVGPAKGVILSHAAMIDRALVTARIEGLSASDVTIAYLPPGWIGQTMFSYAQATAVGYCVCCPESSDTLLGDMREVAPTTFLTTPRMLDTIVSQVSLRMQDTGGVGLSLYRRGVDLAQRIGGRRLTGEPIPLGDRLKSVLYEATVYGPLRDALGMSQVKVAYVAGDAVDPSVLRFFRALGVNLKQLYGSTETAFCTAMQRNGAVKPGTVGEPIDGAEVRISPDGEVLTRSPGLFMGYLGERGGAAAACDADGWFPTGDLGVFDEDGQLRILDRIADIGALTDGTRFPPRQIENKIKFSPYIREAVCFGDGRDGVVALVDINTAAVGRWADAHAIPFTGHADLASRDEVYELIGDFVAEVNAELAASPETAALQVRRYALLPEELSADDGVLTRTGKIRRRVAAERFGAIVERLYAGAEEVAVEVDEGGEAFGGESRRAVKLRDARSAGVSSARRAA